MPTASRLGLLTLLAALAACAPHVDGNGVYAERALSVDPFDRVLVDLPAADDGEPVKATILAREQPRQVVVGGDENVIQHVTVSVEGGRLRARFPADYSYTVVHPLQLRVQAPELVGLEATAGAVVAALGVQAPSFSVTGSDGATLTLTGDGGGDLLVALSGAAHLDAGGYPVTAAQVALSGASRATVWPVEPVSGTADGAGTVLLVKGGAACQVTLTDGATCGAP